MGPKCKVTSQATVPLLFPGMCLLPEEPGQSIGVESLRDLALWDPEASQARSRKTCLVLPIFGGVKGGHLGCDTVACCPAGDVRL